MGLHIIFEEIKPFKIKKRLLLEWVKQIASLHNKKLGEINYIFCSDNKILEINQSYLSHNYFTDIITFDYSEKEIISGDIFISIDTVHDNAETYKVSFEKELLRVFIHGVLHLCGLKDKTKDEKTNMRKAEEDALMMITEKVLGF